MTTCGLEPSAAKERKGGEVRGMDVRGIRIRPGPHSPDNHSPDYSPQMAAFCRRTAALPKPANRAQRLGLRLPPGAFTPQTCRLQSGGGPPQLHDAAALHPAPCHSPTPPALRNAFAERRRPRRLTPHELLLASGLDFTQPLLHSSVPSRRDVGAPVRERACSPPLSRIPLTTIPLTMSPPTGKLETRHPVFTRFTTRLQRPCRSSESNPLPWFTASRHKTKKPASLDAGLRKVCPPAYAATTASFSSQS